MPGNLPPDLAKAALKEALKEWLDDQFALFGRWSAASILAIVFSWAVYVALHAAGWHK